MVGKSIAFLLAVASGLAAFASEPFVLDRSVMGEKYWQIWNDDVQRKIDADIERYRKADAEVEFGVEGAVTNGTVVTVEQIGHAFGFGAHIFNFNQLGKTEWNDAYKANYGAGGIFNQATVAFYWIDYEPVPGRFRAGGDFSDTEEYWNSLTLDQAMDNRFWRRPAAGPVIDFLKAKDVRIHGHILIWGNAKPYWIFDWYCPEEEKLVADGLGVPRHSRHYGWEPCGQNWHNGFMGKWARGWRDSYDRFDERGLAERMPVFAKRLPEIFRKRVFDVARDFGEVVDSWDVVNESAQDWPRYRKARTDLPFWKSVYGLMPGDYPLRALLDAKEAFPARAKLAINDFKINEDFLAQVKALDAEGARIDIVGCQMHIFDTNDCRRLAEGATDVRWVGTPKTISDRLDLMAQTGRPLHVSEVTIAAPGVTDRDRMIQAVLVRNIYRAWFSHPKVSAITWWNTVDGAGVKGEPLVSGLFTRELGKKPAYHALDQLINREWRTTCEVKVFEVERKGGGEGRKVVSFRGFRGRYHLSWKSADGTAESKIVEVN